MKSPKNFEIEESRLNKLANDNAAPIQDRIISLCRLYELYHGDVYMQATTVHRIEDTIRHP
jgi:hypothetical protein